MKETLFRTIYAKVVESGLPGFGTPHQILKDFTCVETGELDVDGMIRRYVTISGGSGFIAGLPGFLALPVVLPVEVAANAALQLHLVAALAASSGADLKDEVIRDECIDCVREPDVHKSEQEDSSLFKRLGVKATERGFRYVGRRTLNKVVKMTPGAGRWMRLPVLGGIVSAVSDAMHTHRVANCARVRFTNEHNCESIATESENLIDETPQ